MPTNDIKPFATGGGANVISQAAYEALAALLANGFTGGIAESAKLNKVWRQSSFMAAVLAQFIADKSGQDVLDNGDVAALVTKLAAAVNAMIASGVPDATTAVKGRVELATVAEAVAGLLSNVAVTPDGLAAALAAAIPSLAAYARLDATQSWTKAQRGSVVALVDGGTITPNFALSNNFSLIIGGNRTLDNPTNIVAGQSGIISITQDATGNRTLAFGSYWKFGGGTVPSLTSTAGAVDDIAYYVESANRIVARIHNDVR